MTTPAVKIQTLPRSQVELEVEISARDLAQFRETALKNLAGRITIKGFRPGKAPLSLVEQELGSDKINEQTLHAALEETYPEAVRNRGLETIGSPEVAIMKFAPGNPLVYKAKVSVLPEVRLPDYKGIAADVFLKEKKDTVVGEKEVEEALAWLQKSRATFRLVSRPAQQGDLVEIDFETRANGVNVENGTSKNHPLIIGEGGFLPGFEDHIIGLEAGKEKEFSLNAPENYYVKNLAGKELHFTVKVNAVQERTFPLLDDDFARSMGGFESMRQLKERVREGMTLEKEQKEKERVRLKVVEAIAFACAFEIPRVLIDYEMEKMFAELARSASRVGLKFDDYLSQIKKTKDELTNELRPDAEKRVRIALVLKEIAKKEQVTVSEEEMAEKINETLKRHSSVEEAKKSVDLEQLKDYTKGVIRNEKVFQLLETS